MASADGQSPGDGTQPEPAPEPARAPQFPAHHWLPKEPALQILRRAFPELAEQSLNAYLELRLGL